MQRRSAIRVALRALSWAALAAAIALASPIAARAQPTDLGAPSREIATLFPSEATIEVPITGSLVRLELPAEVLAACRSDLSDLRVFDAAGREVPFLIESGVTSSSSGEAVDLQAVTVARAEVLQARHETEERERAPLLRRESYILSAPRVAPQRGGWDLVFEIEAADFASQVEIRPAEAPAATGSTPIVSGTVFRLADTGTEKIRLALSGDPGSLEVVLETESSDFLEPAFHFESRRLIAAPIALEAPLEVRSTSSERGATLVVLERPAGLVPSRLRVVSTTPFFQRRMEVWDDGAGARGGMLGRARLLRMQAGAAAAEDLEVALQPARGEALRVVIDDGSSPPLDGLGFVALLPRPALLFALPVGDGAEGGAAQATLRFGGGRAFRPRYDVASLPPSLPAVGESAQIAETLHDVAGLPAATLGAVAANPAYDPRPALEWAQRAGATLDPRLWSHRRGVEARPSPEGLSRLRLAVADLGVARPDLADLRILDGENRQWAYLLERGGAHETSALGVEGPRSRDGATAWTLTPPSAPATADLLTIEVGAPYFDRPFELRARREDEEESVIASGRLMRAAGDPRPVLVPFDATRFDRLELRVVDGDDAPLALTRVEARFPVADVFFAAPAGSYAVLVGQPEAAAPSYELERVRSVVLAVRSAPAEAGALEANGAFSQGARLASGEGWQRVVLWGAILLLVGFLTVLTLRLARREQG